MGWPWTFSINFCVCVSTNYTSQKVHGCKAVSNAFLYDLQSSGGVFNNRGRPRSVCVHGYVVIFLIWVHIEGKYKRTHTHTRTQTQARAHIHTNARTSHIERQNDKTHYKNYRNVQSYTFYNWFSILLLSFVNKTTQMSEGVASIYAFLVFTKQGKQHSFQEICNLFLSAQFFQQLLTSFK